MRDVAKWVAPVLVGAVLVTSACTVQVPGVPAPDPAARTRPAPAERPEGAMFRDAQGRFDLVPPPGWTVDTSGVQSTAVIFADPQPAESASGRFRANINVLVVPSEVDLGGTVANARRELAGLPGYQPTADERMTLPDGSPAQLLGGTFSDPSTGLALRNVQVLTVRDGETVVATGTALSDVWTDYESVFTTSLRSLTVAS